MEALVSAFIAAAISLFTMYITFRRSLDEASGWRQKLFDAASSKCITMEEVYLLRASIRYEPSPNVEEYTFEWICNIMIYYCDYLSLKYANTDSKLKFQEQEIIRIFIRCLLKHHWEHYASMISSLKWHHRSQKPDFIKNSYNKAVEVCHTKEANLLNIINDKMMGRQWQENAMDLDNTNNGNFDYSRFLDKCVKQVSSQSSTTENNKKGWCLTISIPTLLIILLMVCLNITSLFLSDPLSTPLKNALAVFGVLLLICLIQEAITTESKK